MKIIHVSSLACNGLGGVDAAIERAEGMIGEACHDRVDLTRIIHVISSLREICFLRSAKSRFLTYVRNDGMRGVCAPHE